MRPMLPVALSVTVVALAGCGANTYATAAPRSNVDLERRVVRDPGLASDVQIVAQRVDSAEGIAIGWITVRNSGGGPRRILVRWDWFDKQGRRASMSDQPWQDYMVDAGAERDFSSAGGRNGADFRVTIKNY